MPVIQDRYGGAYRDVGAPIMVDFLRGWFATRKEMNDAARADAAGESPDDIAEMELAAREDLGKLQRALAQARSGDSKAASDLARTVVETKGDVRIANVRAQADVARQKLYVEAQWMSRADKEA